MRHDAPFISWKTGKAAGHDPPYEDMPRYRRYWVQGGTYFFTVNLLERQSSLLTDHIRLLRQSVAVTRRRLPFHIDAWVVLPDHLHAVWTLPEGDSDFATRWRLIKFGFSKALPATERLSVARKARSTRVRRLT